MSTIEWVREPLNRWTTCTHCNRSGRWLLHILGHPTPGAICDHCKHDMTTAWNQAGGRT